MKKSLILALDDQEVLDLCQILIDQDAEGALAFLQKHVKHKARDLLEGG